MALFKVYFSKCFSKNLFFKSPSYVKLSTLTNCCKKGNFITSILGVRQRTARVNDVDEDEME